MKPGVRRKAPYYGILDETKEAAEAAIACVDKITCTRGQLFLSHSLTALTIDRLFFSP
jgi:hypothetical protein